MSRKRSIASTLRVLSGSVAPSNNVAATSPYNATASYPKIDSDDDSSFRPFGYGLPSIVTTPLAHENPKNQSL